MKKIINLIILVLVTGCSESFLDTEPLTQKVDENFYRTPADAEDALTGCYASLPAVPAAQCFFLVANELSDDQFGGAGENDPWHHAPDAFKKWSDDDYIDAWSEYYKGIFRCNMLIKKIDQIEWDNEVQKGQIEAEARFLRAYFYFDIARMFGNVPLIIETNPLNLPKASAEEIYAQIATDLKLAIEKFPPTPITQMDVDQLGYATKWAAQGLMARVFLFYTGYYEKTALPLLDGDGEISKNQVIAWIDECIDNSGYDLLSDFRSLWPYSVVNRDYTYSDGTPQYAYAYDNDLSWIGEEGANTETVFAIKYSNLATWDTRPYSNQINLFCGFRSQTQVPFGGGWGCATVNAQLWDTWLNDEPNDIRRQASILDVNDTSEGTSGYIWWNDNQYNETGYWQKKYMPINIQKSDGSIVNYSCILYGTTSNFQLDNTQDLVIIRFADILLMGAELGGPNAQSYLDRVRQRAGLPFVPCTLENIKKERRYELAFEAVRYYDLLRWHNVEEAFEKIVDVPMYNSGNLIYKTINYRPETRGFLPIPESEIELSGGVLTQNPGWTDASSNYAQSIDQ